jgi:hypothetical protein
VLALSSALLLFSAFNSEALTARTTNVINGHAPYLTFDGGTTKVTDTEGLLGITIPGIGNIKPNDPRAASVIEMVNDNVSFNDIGMLVPPNTSTVSLSTLIGPPNNYWGDDDGDGNATATGDLTLTILDKDSHSVNRGETLTICKSPYTLKLQSTAGTLRTRYGVPNSSTFSGGTATYQLKSKNAPTVCFAKPGIMNNPVRSPSNIWNPTKGFLVQSTVLSSYGLNFPTTGANKLYFDLDISGGVNVADLTWNSPTHKDITASVTLNGNMARVTLTGPDRSNAATKQKLSSPETFELIASKNGAEVFRYGFVLKQWFVNSGSTSYNASGAQSFCSGMNYQMPRVRDLTNAVCSGANSGPKCIGSVGATPSSGNNYYMRHSDAGFFSEWGDTSRYTGAGFTNGVNGYWTSDVAGRSQFNVYSRDGGINNIHSHYAVCASSLP